MGAAGTPPRLVIQRQDGRTAPRYQLAKLAAHQLRAGRPSGPPYGAVLLGPGVTAAPIVGSRGPLTSAKQGGTDGACLAGSMLPLAQPIHRHDCTTRLQ